MLILADDLGINDVSTHGGGHTAVGVPTPAIDSIAREGVRFDAGYAASAVCTVSRAALMTERYPWRFGVEFTPTPGAMARVLPRLARDEGQLHRIEVDQDKASRTPNAMGLFDMICNVWELTADAWTPNHAARARRRTKTWQSAIWAFAPC